MAYDRGLADRVRRSLRSRPGIVEKPMFGGLTILQRGKMVCGIVRDELMVRVGPEAYDQALALPHVRPMDFTGRPLRGFVYVGREGIANDDDLAGWIQRGLASRPSSASEQKRKKVGRRQTTRQNAGSG